jgi:hypothetical protein
VTSVLALFTLTLAEDKKPVCDLKMFGGPDKGQEAVTACEALDVLQYNWYPDPLEGLCSY